MKIIDVETRGNVVRFYLGDDDCQDYHGDDWNDRPYECNAGPVYEEYVKAVRDVAFSFDDLVLEPFDGEPNGTWISKDDMKARKCPCLIVVPKAIKADSYNDRFSEWIGADGISRFYFGDPMSPFGCTLIPFED